MTNNHGKYEMYQLLSLSVRIILLQTVDLDQATPFSENGIFYS